MTWSTCWPQPAHVVLPQVRHATALHMGGVFLHSPVVWAWRCVEPEGGGAGLRVVVGPVHEDRVVPSAGEDGGGDRRAVARSAVDPDLRLGHAAEADPQMVDRHVQGAAHAAGGALVGSADIEDGGRPGRHGLRESGEVGDRPDRRPRGARR